MVDCELVSDGQLLLKLENHSPPCFDDPEINKIPENDTDSGFRFKYGISNSSASERLLESMRCCITEYDSIFKIVHQVFEMGVSQIVNCGNEEQVVMIRDDLMHLSQAVDRFVLNLGIARLPLQSAISLSQDLLQVRRYGTDFKWA